MDPRPDEASGPGGHRRCQHGDEAQGAGGGRPDSSKPPGQREVIVRIENLLESRLLQRALREQAKELKKAVEEQGQELTDAALEAIEPLAVAAAYRDDDQVEHAPRVARASAMLARELGLQEETVEMIGRAARLHDVGKIGLSDGVLLHPDGHAPEDLELVKSHVEIGAEILGRGRSRLLKMAAEIARSHHERWDGSGYPEGLRGEQIPMSGRIVGLADTFDGLVHAADMPLADAVIEIESLGGRYFDPRVVSAFTSIDHELLVAPPSRAVAAV